MMFNSIIIMMNKYKALLLITFICLSLATCSSEPINDSLSESEKETFTEMFYDFYDTYGAGDISFVDYFAEDVITMDNRGETTVGSENYRDVWTENFKIIAIERLDYTDPEIIFGRDLIVTYNDYDEQFLYLESGETRDVRGTWIAVWEKRGDDWKIAMNTFHLKDSD